MKLLIISDLHGRIVWKEADFSRYGRVVFLGDYTDSFVVDDDTIFNNLSEIIQLKCRNAAKFILLIGNHDAQYLHFPYYRCSGFRAWAQPALSTLFTKHEALFQIAHQEGTYLFTHAGVSGNWFTRLRTKMQLDEYSDTPGFDVANLLNDVHRQSLRFRNILFDVGPKRGGMDSFSGPVWADRDETRTDFLPGFHQFVGHTPIDDITTYGSATGSITYTDVLEKRTKFHEIVIPD